MKKFGSLAMLTVTGIFIAVSFQNCGPAANSPSSLSSNDQSSTAANGSGLGGNPTNTNLPGGSLDPNTPVSTQTSSCDIVGGAGAQLYSNAAVTQATCESNCKSQQPQHPNLSCKWSGTDITPTTSCIITGGAGALLFNGTVSQGVCTTQCASEVATHPNLSCKSGTADITPVGTCSVVGGAGAVLVNKSETHAQCAADCSSNLAVHPKEVCKFNGAAL